MNEAKCERCGGGGTDASKYPLRGCDCNGTGRREVGPKWPPKGYMGRWHCGPDEEQCPKCEAARAEYLRNQLPESGVGNDECVGCEGCDFHQPITDRLRADRDRFEALARENAHRSAWLDNAIEQKRKAEADLARERERGDRLAKLLERVADGPLSPPLQRALIDEIRAALAAETKEKP